MGRRTTQQYREAAHKALYPLWHACQDKLAEQGEAIGLPSGSITKCETPDGAIIHRLGDIVMVEGDFVIFDGKGRELIEEVTITFPEDIRDLADANIDTFGATAGSVGVRNYPLYARSMLNLVTGGQVGSGQITS